MKRLYTTAATVNGPRRGRATSHDGRLDLWLDLPVELGGDGAGTNPEQLFAAGYASCFHAALTRIARRSGVDTAGAEVTAHVSLVPIGEGRFGLEVRLEAWLSDVDAERTRALMAEAHEVCPYSNATRGNVVVELAAAEAARLAS